MKLVKNTNENKIIDTIESTKLGLELATSTLNGGRFERLNYNSKKTFFFLLLLLLLFFFPN